MNRIHIVGNIVRDPELRFTNSNMAVCKFSVADTHGTDTNKTTTFHDCVAFKEQAENIASSVRKGQRVMVDGRLQKENYEAKDGTKKTRVEVLVDEVGISLRWANVGEHQAERNVTEAFNADDNDEDGF